MINKDEIIIHRKITSCMAPGITKIHNKCYMVFNGPDGGWFEISDDITLDDVERIWINKVPNLKNKNDNNDVEILVEGSKGKSYSVIFKNGTPTCTCSGFSFRRKCKHLEIAKTKL